MLAGHQLASHHHSLSSKPYLPLNLWHTHTDLFKPPSCSLSCVTSIVATDRSACWLSILFFSSRFLALCSSSICNDGEAMSKRQLVWLTIPQYNGPQANLTVWHLQLHILVLIFLNSLIEYLLKLNSVFLLLFQFTFTEILPMQNSLMRCLQNVVAPKLSLKDFVNYDI